MRVIEFLCILIIISAAIFIVNPIFKEGFLICQDNPSHLAETYFLTNNLTSKGKLFGWADLEAGYPIFMYVYPLGFWLIGLINLFLADPILSYKILVFLSYAGVPLTLFLILRRFGIAAALVISVLLLFQYDFVSFPLNGLWGQYFALIFGLGYIAYLDKVLSKQFNFKETVILSILLTLTLLAHLFTAVFALYFSLILCTIYAFSNKSRFKKIFVNLITIFILTLIFSSFYLIPIIETSNVLVVSVDTDPNSLSFMIFKSLGYTFLPHLRIPELKTLVGWKNGISVQNFIVNINNIISAGSLNIAELIFAILFTLGLVTLLKQGSKDKFVISFLITFFISLIIGSEILQFTPLNSIPLIRSILQYPRYFVYVRIAMAVVAAFGLYKLLSLKQVRAIESLLTKKILVLLTILIFLVLYSSYSTLRESGFLCEQTSVNELKEINEVWKWIKNNVNPTETRVFYQNTFGNFPYKPLKDSHIFSLSYHYTGVESIGTWQGGYPSISNLLYSGSSQLFNSTNENISDLELVNWLKLYNSKYIVTSENFLKNKLLQSGNFILNTSFGNFSIFSLKDYMPTWLSVNGNDTKAEVVSIEGEEKIFIIGVEKTQSEILVKISYHPYWHVFVNGREIKVGQTKEGMMKFDVNSIGNLKIQLVFGGSKIGWNKTT